MKIWNKRNKILIFVITAIIFASLNIDFAKGANISISRSFGGKIISSKAMKIKALESSGFVCTMPGTSVSILPIGSPPGTPTDFIIPYVVIPKTGNKPEAGKYILGTYFGKMTAVCVLQTSETPIINTVILDSINYYGTSGGTSQIGKGTSAKAMPPSPVKP